MEYLSTTAERRVNAIEQKMDAELKAGDAIHEKLDTASQTRYDKTDAKIEALDTKIDALKDTMNTRFDNLRDTAASARRAWVQWSIGLGLGLFGGSGIGSLIWYLIHLSHP